MNKRDLVLSILDKGGEQTYVPAAFFLHFDKSCHRGRAAIDKHMEYFRYTGMDFVKIQFENPFPSLPEIATVDDWAKMPVYGRDFYEGQIEVVKGLIQEAKRDALVLSTLYSPFMCANQTTREADGHSRLIDHIVADPDKAKAGIERIGESLLIYVRACIDLGIDGFYASTQGGEADRFADRSLFAQVIKPTDMVIMEEINRRCGFNILHVCDYHDSYDDLSPLLDYPGDVVNVSLHLGDGELTPSEAYALFGERPFMGGLERKGIIAHGDEAQVRAAVQACLAAAPDRYILGADCTVPSDTSWDNLKTAISVAHGQ